MDNLNKYIAIYKAQLEQGDILIAYNELVKFVMKLRTDFTNSLSEKYVFGGILHGYMDYTYFYFSNDFLKMKKLKFALVLNHLKMRFELWLLGNTKPIQKQYWHFLKDSPWNNGKEIMPEFAIIESILVDTPDFNNLNNLEKDIEKTLINSSKDILNYLLEN